LLSRSVDDVWEKAQELGFHAERKPRSDLIRPDAH
jgi:hypothetical protein